MNGELKLIKYTQRRLNKFSYAVAGLITAILLAGFFSLGNLYPFGTKSIAWCDMDEQVIPLMADFKDILAGKSSILLSMQNAGGMNFWGVFLFFICSPFSFLVAFVEKADLKLFMNVLVILKMIVCSVTASIYFKKRFKHLDAWFNIVLSVMYAFSGYAMLFYQNVVWLDVMYLFPLLLLSFEKLIYEKKVIPYSICLSAIVVMQFYLGYMAVVYTLLFFGAYMLLDKDIENKKQICSLFIVGSFLAALISAAAWLPSLIQCIDSARVTSIYNSLTRCDFIGKISTTGAIIACTAIIPSALVNLSGCLRDKRLKLYGTMFICTVIPIFVEPINRMWHTGSYQCFPARYGYATIFCGLILAAAILSKRHEEPENGYKIKNIFIPAFLTIFSIAVVIKYSKDNIYTLDEYTNSLWGNENSGKGILAIMFIMMLAYTSILYFYKNSLIRRQIAAILLIPAMVAECLISTNVYMVSAGRDSSRFEAIMSIADKIDDKDFYRVKSDKKYFNVNNIGAMGYNTIAHYTSLNKEDFFYGMKKFGYSAYWMELGAQGGTLFSDAFLSNKYYISSYNYDGGGSYYTLNRNDYCIPLGVVTKSDLTKNTEMSSRERFDIQNEVFKSVYNTSDDLFSKYDFWYTENIDELYLTEDYAAEEHIFYRMDSNQNGLIKYHINVKGKEELYFECFDNLSTLLEEHINHTFDIYVNGKKLHSDYPNKSYNGILRLGTFEDEAVDVDLYVKDDIYCKSFGVAGLKYSVLERYINTPATGSLNVNGRKISGSYTVDDDSWLIIQVPYDRGFSAEINGEKAEIHRVYSCFMAVRLSKGENNIELSYMPIGLTGGIFLTILGIALTVLFAVYRHKHKGSLIKSKVLNMIMYVLVIIAGTATLIGIYFVPVILNIFFE